MTEKLLIFPECLNKNSVIARSHAEAIGEGGRRGNPQGSKTRLTLIHGLPRTSDPNGSLGARNDEIF